MSPEDLAHAPAVTVRGKVQWMWTNGWGVSPPKLLARARISADQVSFLGPLHLLPRRVVRRSDASRVVRVVWESEFATAEWGGIELADGRFAPLAFGPIKRFFPVFQQFNWPVRPESPVAWELIERSVRDRA